MEYQKRNAWTTTSEYGVRNCNYPQLEPVFGVGGLVSYRPLYGKPVAPWESAAKEKQMNKFVDNFIDGMTPGTGIKRSYKLVAISRSLSCNGEEPTPGDAAVEPPKVLHPECLSTWFVDLVGRCLGFD